MRRPPGPGGLFVVGAILLAACGRPLSTGSSAATRAPTSRPSSPGERAVQSNVTREDYVGSAACEPCHPDASSSWARSPMHRMTRDPRGAEVRAPFDGTRWRFKEDAVVLEQRDGDRYLRIEPGTSAPRAYRITRVIGGRTREDFAGVEVGGNPEELVLPVSFVYATGSLRYKGYSVMVHERATLRAGPVWSRTCIFCHNTIPEVDRLFGAVAGPRAPGYQGEVVDAWLPVERRSLVRILDAGGFARVAGDEMIRLGGARPGSGDDPRKVARAAIAVVRAGFDGASLVETGIGCEACHGGAREHARDPAVHPSFEPRAPWLEVQAPRSTRAQSIDRVCARCHQVLFSRYPYTWEGGRRDATAGGSHIASGEARDFLLGGCAGEMSCTNCHDPHGGDAPAATRRLVTPEGNGKCTSCHAQLADRERARAHSHHDPAGAGGACIACHMPRKNMGLDGALTSYHRIGSPTDPARVLGDRPLECALCHADRSVASLVDSMEKWWPVRYPRQRLTELYGSLDANVLRATLERGKAHEQAVAIGVLGEVKARDAAPLVAKQLSNEYPLVREWARRALDAMGVPADAPAPAPPGTDEEPED